eukprot:6720091-Pyramimonas_sp.AAC.1
MPARNTDTDRITTAYTAAARMGLGIDLQATQRENIANIETTSWAGIVTLLQRLRQARLRDSMRVTTACPTGLRALLDYGTENNDR